MRERAVETHDLAVLTNLYELLRWLAGERVPREIDRSGNDADVERTGSCFERDEVGEYLRPLRRPLLRGIAAELADQLGVHCQTWIGVHQHLDEHFGKRSNSRRPLEALVRSLWNHRLAGEDVTETEISLALIGLDVPDISRTTPLGLEGKDGEKNRWFEYRTVLNVVRKAVAARGGSRRHRRPKEEEDLVGGNRG